MNSMMARLLAIALLASIALPATAQTFPDRAVKLIVPWAAGGDTDNIFRPFAAMMQKQVGQPVVIANVTGASGTTGTREAKGAPADGYTVFAIHDFIHTVYYVGITDINYWDFEPICMLSATPSVLTASAKTPWNDWQSLLEDARKRPGQISVGATLGSTSHFFPALIEKAAGIKFKYVSYDGLAPRMNALLGGHIDLTDSNLTQKGKVDAGLLKFIAIASDKRDPEMPNVPTLKELGVDVSYEVSRGLVVPKGTPAPVRAKLEEACKKTAADPEFAAAMKLQGTHARFLDSAAYTEFMKKNDQANKDLARDLGLLKR